MKIFKLLTKLGALVTAIVALLCFANVKEDKQYVIVYEDENV